MTGVTKFPQQKSIQTLLILTNLPDRQSANEMAKVLIEERLAACVNILGDCSSVYRWEGKIENATEVPMLIKTRADCYQQVEQAIKRLHPYELPEIIAVPIVEGLPNYLKWVHEQTSPASE